METAPMAGKSRQPSHEPPCRRKKNRHPSHWWNSGKKARDRGGETTSKDSPHSGKTLRKTLNRTPTKLLQCPMNQEHEESWLMHISNKPLTVRIKLVLLVVNSVNSIAFNYIYQLPCKVEVGYLRHPGASTIGSQLLAGGCSHGWQIWATQPRAPTPNQ